MHSEIIEGGGQGGKRPTFPVQAWRSALVCSAGALVWKGLLLALDAFPFNADEAVVGLMARHILHGERPIFFYGQAYMGSLDAALVALAFAAFGQSVLAIRIVQSLLYAGTVLTGTCIAWRVTGRLDAAWAAGLILAVPNVNTTLYTTVSLGGYGEVLLIGNVLLLLALAASKRADSLWLLAGWGLLVGLGWWTFGLIMVYALPAGLFLAWSVARFGGWQRGLGYAMVIGAMVGLGAAPWLAWAWKHGLVPLLQETAGSAIAGASAGGFLAATASHLTNLLLLGSTVVLGLRPPWEVRWLALPLLPLVVAFWLGALAFGFARMRAGKARSADLMLLGVVVVLVLGFVLTPFGADPSGRYFLPLGVPMAVLAGRFLAWLTEQRAGRLSRLLLLGLLGFHAWATLDCALRPTGLTTQFDANTRYDHEYDMALLGFLREAGETRGYTNYWVAYPLAFLSNEELIFIPRLPYHPDLRYTPRDDRYPPYGEQVAASPRVAYITARHPALDDRLRAGLLEQGIEWREATVGDYRVFYALSRPVPPEALELGISE